MQSAGLYFLIMLNVIMLSVVMLGVVMLYVVVPSFCLVKGASAAFTLKRIAWVNNGKV
jgi:hypothetical protein